MDILPIRAYWIMTEKWGCDKEERVDTADFNPIPYPDYWRGTITVVSLGAGSMLTETVSSSVGLPKPHQRIQE